ncbi:GAF domain-containing protein [Thiocystis minor]|uniref:GAF domain-containing protein n=1 Tax=Thiocystis minor TaxID=61597 RepID=UPI0019136C49
MATLLGRPQALLFVRAAQDILNVRHAAAGLMDQGGRVVHLATRGLPDAVHHALATQPPSGLIAQALRQGTPQSIRDWSGETPPPGLPDGHPPLRTLLALPVHSAVRTYGWLYLADKLGADAFAIEDEQIAATFAAQLALACENLALFEEAQEYARELEREVTERRASELRFRHAVEEGAFALAWIGLPDGESLRPRAWRARDPQAHPQAIGPAVSAADEAEARRVLDSGRVSIRNDLRLEESAAGPLDPPWAWMSGRGPRSP